MKTIKQDTLQGPDANVRGEYPMHLQASVEILNLAIAEGAVDESTVEVFIHDFRNAKNALEVLKVKGSLTRILYRKAVDYSDILLNTGCIDVSNHRLLKSNIQRGKEFTNQDLDDADRIDSIGVRAAKGIDDPGKAGAEILNGLKQMENRKGKYPEK